MVLLVNKPGVAFWRKSLKGLSGGGERLTPPSQNDKERLHSWHGTGESSRNPVEVVLSLAGL
jgi:hypothetical protein